MIGALVRSDESARTPLTLASGSCFSVLFNWALWSTLLGMSADLRADWATQTSARPEQQSISTSSRNGKHRSEWLAKISRS